MDEIGMFRVLRPEPGSLDVSGARERLTDAISHHPGAWSRPRRRIRFTLIGGLVAAAAAVAVVVPSLLPDGGSFTGRAWAVDRQSDGTITVTVKQEFRDPAGLQRALRADGVLTYVRMVTFVRAATGSGLVTKQTCAYTSLNGAAVAVSHAVISYIGSSGTSDKPLTEKAWAIHPGAMPRGSALLFQASFSREVTIIAAPVVLLSGKLPACLPVVTNQRARASARPGLPGHGGPRRSGSH